MSIKCAFTAAAVLSFITMAQLQITVNGTGSAIRPAERAILKLQVQSSQLNTEAEASAAAVTAANAVRDTITPYCPQDHVTNQTLPDAPISHYSMSTMDTTSHMHRDKDGKTTTRFSARAEFNIKFQDFGALNTLATRFSAMENVKILRIEWRLTDDTYDSIKGGARKDAARDAIQKAWDYAEVFADVPSAELKSRVRPSSVSEQGYYSQSTRPQLHQGKGMRGSLSNREELQFEPEDVKLDVTVTATFKIDI